MSVYSDAVMNSISMVDMGNLDSYGTVVTDQVGTVVTDQVGTVVTDQVGTVVTDQVGTVVTDQVGTGNYVHTHSRLDV